jgi:hypothetical protein
MGNQQQNIGSNQSILAALAQPVAGEPYQAEKISRSTQTLSDGTVIAHESKGRIARDAEGRIHEDIYIVHSGQVDGKQMDLTLQSATVGDPVAHTMLIWTDEKSKIAMQMQLPTLPAIPKTAMTTMLVAPPLPPPPPPPGAPAGTVVLGRPMAGPPIPSPSKDQVRTEDLGKQSIDGVLVTGKRTTTTIPTGSVGNDRPIMTVHEEWRSPELNILVKTIDTDPRTGEQTMVLESLTRMDPDAALFHAPAGYKVQDMADLMKGFGAVGKPSPQ